ncbi:MAG: signal peptidase II [Rubrimonas sp.]|uniref:signal peptidase II n=1 Tax=Rubrimonas sp. TaxID=2036015 RepID=UPI002FDEA8A3
MMRGPALTLWTAVAVLLADRLSKWAVVEAMGLRERLAIDVAPGFVSLRMAWNRGVNFGLFADDAPALRFGLAGLAVAISAVVAIWALRRRERLFGFGAGMLIGGALGNAWDRVAYGAVADFLNVTCCGIDNPYAFNIADVAIFAGAFALILAPAPGEASDPAAEPRR